MNEPKADTPRTERLLAAMEREKQDIWQALKTLTEWACGLERELIAMQSLAAQAAKGSQPEDCSNIFIGKSWIKN